MGESNSVDPIVAVDTAPDGVVRNLKCDLCGEPHPDLVVVRRSGNVTMAHKRCHDPEAPAPRDVQAMHALIKANYYEPDPRVFSFPLNLAGRKLGADEAAVMKLDREAYRREAKRLEAVFTRHALAVTGLSGLGLTQATLDAVFLMAWERGNDGGYTFILGHLEELAGVIRAVVGDARRVTTVGTPIGPIETKEGTSAK